MLIILTRLTLSDFLKAKYQFMRKLKILFQISVIFFAACSFAAEKINYRSDPEFVQSSKCMAHFKRLENKYGIPKDLLHSISLQESGRKHSKIDKKIPWPWTVNVEGKGYYFDSKGEAVSFVKSQMSKGKKSIDVGCMQISLLYHGDAFKSLSEAFDPWINVDYGASFLKEKYVQYGSWKKAIGSYHSANEERGAKYRNSVIKIASNIDKHKFDIQKSRSILEPVRPLYTMNPKPDPRKFADRREKKIKSNMMVYIPKNAYRRFN